MMARRILGSFKGRLWVPSTDILERLWRGVGFGALACHNKSRTDREKPLGCSSTIFRENIKTVCRREPALASAFLNELLNHMNWTVTEFDHAIQDIRSSAESVSRGQEDQERYRRCYLMFDIGVHLIKILEGFVLDLPWVFFGSDETQLNTVRVVELMVHLLGRVTSSDVYGSVLDSDLLSSSSNRFLMLCPILGVIMNLLASERQTQMAKKDVTNSKVLETIFENPGFKIDHLYSISEEILSQEPSDLSDEEKAQFDALLNTFIDGHSAYQEAQKRAKEAVVQGGADAEEDDDNLCSICYSNPISATFFPCHHRSCRMCISRHLLNNKACFFCNAVVDRVEYDGGAEESTKQEAPDEEQRAYDDVNQDLHGLVLEEEDESASSHSSEWEDEEVEEMVGDHLE